jgi:MFS transporter, PPP family, 3-phenylpropionic acid transporter
MARLHAYSYKLVNVWFRPRSMTARVFGLRISMAYALMMIGSGVQLPFLPLWLKAKGLDTASIAMVVAGMMAVRVLGAPLFAWIADHFGNRKLVIQLCAGFAFAAYVLLAISNGFGPITTMALIAGFMFAPVFALTEGFSVDGAAAHGLDYGRLRLWASLSFLMGSVVSGALLTKLDPLSTAWLIAMAQGLSFLSTLLLPDEPKRPQHVETQDDMLGRARDLFFGSSFPLLMLVAGLGQASHAMIYTSSSLHWTSLGFNSFDISLLWVAAVTAEVFLLGFSNRLLEALGPSRLLLLGLSGGVLRWTMMATFSNYELLLLSQALHGLTFASAHLGAMHFIRLMVPPDFRNRAQGLYSALSGGVLMSSMAWMSGRLYGSWGGQAYYAMAVVSLTALLLALALMRFNPRVRMAGAA